MENAKLEKLLVKYESEEKFKTLSEGMKNLLHTYYCSKGKHNVCGMLIVDDIIWDSEIEDFVNGLKKYGVTEFVYGATWSSAINTLMYFMEHGYQVAGTIVYSESESVFGGKDIKKGIKLILK